MMQNYTPQNAFDAYVWAHGFEDNAAVGKLLGVSGEMVRRWRQAVGSADFTRPSQRRMQDIYVWTGGKVTPNHWFNLRAAVLPTPDGRAAFPVSRAATSPGGGVPPGAS